MGFKKDSQFVASKEDLTTFFSLYGIENFSFSLIKAGIENSSYIITSGDDKYVLRVYRQNKKSIDDVTTEIEFMELLLQNKIPVPRIFANKEGKKITKFYSKQIEWVAILMDFVDGYHSETCSDYLIDQLAKYQAKIHILGAEYANSKLLKPKKGVVGNEFIGLIDTDKVENIKLRELLERSKSCIYEYQDNLPFGYIHLDYDSENILVDGNEDIRGILDFDDMEYAPLVVCLAYSLWAVIMTTGDLNSVKRYISEYQKIRKLERLEMESIAGIMLVRHYTIAGLEVLRNTIDEEGLVQYLKIEKIIKDLRF